MSKLIRLLFFCGLIAGVIGWIATAPKGINPARFANLNADVDRGALVYAASGCAACHAAPKAKGGCLLERKAWEAAPKARAGACKSGP